VEEAVFFSSNILSTIAYNAAKGSLTAPDDNVVSTLFSAAWVEASLNEILHDLTVKDEALLDPQLHNAKRVVAAANLFESRAASVELKLNVLCATAAQREIEWGSEPWQHLSLLLQVRNWLMHLRPERMKVRLGTEDEPSTLVSREVHKLVTGLKNAGAIPSIPEGRLVSVATAASLRGVGVWSYSVAYNTLAEVGAWHLPWKRSLLLAHEPIEIDPHV